MSLSASKPYPSITRAIVLVIMALALQVLLGMLFGFVFALSGLKLQAWHYGLINCVALGLVFGWGFLEADEPIRAVLPFRGISIGLLVAMSISVIGVFILLGEVENVMSSFARPNNYFVRIFNDLLGPKANPIGVVFLLVIVAPFTEEPLFRGLILNGFLNRYSVRWSIVISAVLFALIHVNPFQFPVGLALGLLFGWWRVRTQSLWPCIWGHALNNGLAAILVLFGDKIVGITANHAPSQFHFQPLWFDLLGLTLTITGLSLTALLFRNQPSVIGALPLGVSVPVLLGPRPDIPAGPSL